MGGNRRDRSKRNTLLADMEYSSSLVRKLILRFYRRWIVAIKG